MQEKMKPANVSLVRHIGLATLMNSGLYPQRHASKDWREFKMADEASNFDDEFYRKLLLEETKKLENVAPDTIEFVPKPGFVMKLRNSKEEKVFINVCTSEKVPAAKEVSEEELAKILHSVDPTQYRVPMSLGEPHVELDNRGEGCTAYDIVINPTFYNKIQNSELFKSFFLTLVFEGLESKYDIELERNWTVLKNKKCMGVLQPHFIRSKSKPVIMEMEDEDKSSTREAHKKIEEVDSKSVIATPQYHIIREPPDGRPEFLVIEINLPGIKSTKDTTLDVGEDRLVLSVNPDKYHLDLNLPFDVDNEICGAQFNRKTKILTLTLPVLNSS
ncbi:PIH1 domain-containing protein 1-like isoform X2 [Oculina patagonica]